jgi:hypothetical protein
LSTQNLATWLVVAAQHLQKKRMVQKSGMTVKGELSQYSFISGALAKGRL